MRLSCVLAVAFVLLQETLSDGCFPRTNKIMAAADVSVSELDKGRSDGTTSNMLLGQGVTGEHEIYLKFDLSTIDLSTLLSVKLNLPIGSSYRSSKAAFHKVIGLTQVGEGWDESGLSWGSRPEQIGDEIKWSVARNSQDQMTTNMTSWVRELLAVPGAPTQVALRLAIEKESSDLWTMASRESEYSKGAMFVVEHRCVTAPPTLRAQQISQDARAIYYQVPAEADTYLRDGDDEHRNFGSERLLILEGSNPKSTSSSAALVRFKIPVQLKKVNFHAIMHAEIKLTKMRETTKEEMETLKVRLVVDDWHENTVTSKVGVRNAFYVHFCNTRNLQNPSSPEFVIDVTEELKELLDSGKDSMGIQLYLEGDAHVEKPPQDNLLPMAFLSRENEGGVPTLSIGQKQVRKGTHGQ